MYTGAWLLWLAFAVGAVATTRNPLYLTLLLVIFALVFETCERVRRDGAVVQPGRFALFAIALGRQCSLGCRTGCR